MQDLKTNLNTEIRELQKKLNQINEEKESWFNKKESLKKEISNLIKDIKIIKSKNSVVSSEFKKNRLERDKYNDLVKESIKKIKELNNKKFAIINKYKIKGDPAKILGFINYLEEKIETEALSFEKEKELMKKINAIKKQYSINSELSSILEQYSNLSLQIKEAKKNADHFHKLLNKYKSKNDSVNKDIVEIYKKIMNLRRDEELAFKKFLEFKKEFSKINNELKQKLLHLNCIRKGENREKQILLNKKQQILQSKLNDKIQKIEEKIKSKKKLTTEDLLVFQNSNH